MTLLSFVNYLRAHGAAKSVQRAIERLGFVRYDRTLLFFRVAFEDVPDAQSDPCDLHTATAEDIRARPVYEDGWFQREGAIEHLLGGNRLLHLKKNDEVAVSVWLDFRKVLILWLDLSFDIPPDVAYLRGFFTSPAYRQKGFASAALRQVLHDLRQEGFRHVFAVIGPNNAASIALNMQRGLREYQRVRCRRYWHLRLYTITGARSNVRKTVVAPFQSPSLVWRTFWDARPRSEGGA